MYDVRVATPSSPSRATLSYHSTSVPAGETLRISVAADTATFSTPGGGAAIPASSLSWTTHSAVGGVGSPGTLSSGAFQVIFDSAPDPTSGSVELAWTLAAPPAGVAAGDHELVVRYRFESLFCLTRARGCPGARVRRLALAQERISVHPDGGRLQWPRCLSARTRREGAVMYWPARFKGRRAVEKRGPGGVRHPRLGRAGALVGLGALLASSVGCLPDFELDGLTFACEGDLCRYADLPARCDQTIPADLTTSAAHRDALVFASLMDRSVVTQQARERAIRLAVMQANELGGVDGRTVGLIQCTIAVDPSFDSRNRTEAAVHVADRLAGQVGIWAIVGPSASSDVGAVFTAVRDRNVLVISPSATSSALTDMDVTEPTDERPGLLWRTAPPDSLQAAVIAADMDDRGVASVAAIYAEGAYGEGLTRELERSFSGEVSLRSFSTPAGRDEAVVGAPALASEVFFVSSVVDDAVAFLNTAAGLPGYDGVGIFLPDSAATDDFLDGTATVGQSRYPSVRGTRPATPSGFVYSAFVNSYTAAFQESPDGFSFVAHSYDAAWMVIYALAWAELNEEGHDGVHLARGLRRLSAGRAFEVRPGDFQSIIQAFREGAGVDIAGSSGSLDYDLATEETTGPIELWRISEDGTRFVCVRVVEPSVVGGQFQTCDP